MYKLTIDCYKHDTSLKEELLFAYGALSVSVDVSKRGKNVITALFDTYEKAEIALHTKEFVHGKIAEYNKDWNNEWLKNAAPVYLTSDLLVIPSGYTYHTVKPDCHVLIINAENTFGYGTHATTKISARLLRKYSYKYKLSGKKVLDIGCGSGVLSLYASLLGAEYITGIDIDKQAVSASRINAEENHIANCSFNHSIVEDAKLEEYDVLIMNIPLQVIENNIRYFNTNSRHDIIISGFGSEHKTVVKGLFSEYYRIKYEESEQLWCGFLLMPKKG